MQHERVLVLDFGGQYNQLIARRVRDLNVYCDLKPCDMTVEEIRAYNPIGIIFTGGPNSVYDPASPHIDEAVLSLGIPVLGICYGCQLIAYTLGGKVEHAAQSEYGKREFSFVRENLLSVGIPRTSVCWMSHTDHVTEVPQGFAILASTESCPVTVYGSAEKRVYGVQFHPEVVHSEYGNEILKNFLYNVCGAKGDWTMSNFVAEQVASLKAKIGDKKVLCAMSGGVDSAVAATLVHRAVGDRLVCVFVDHGLLRKGESEEVMDVFKGKLGMNLIRADAGERFLTKLEGVSEPEQKRKIIGAEFIKVFEAEAKKIGHVDFLAQGTIYPDIIESGAGDAAVIKSHHNVGGLPDYVDFREIIEPLRLLFKDEVRALGTTLGLSEKLVWRQPFPGPGLAIRIIGEITDERLEILKDADWVFRDELAKCGLDRQISQYFAVLTTMRSVGVMGDGRTYDYTLALRAVTTTDFMTADFARIPYDVLERCAVRIVNEVKHINRIVYDITTKPPATIEWE